MNRDDVIARLEVRVLERPTACLSTFEAGKAAGTEFRRVL
jgi:hypothetical protein